MRYSDGTPAPAKSSTGRVEKITKIGTVATAVMASACCWLPLILLAVGVSGAGIASTLEAYRPVFIAVTVGFLAAAFYFTFRPRSAAAAARDSCCAPEGAQSEDCCSPTRKGRFRILAVNKVMLWIVTVLAVAFLFFPSYVGMLFETGREGAVTDDMNRSVFNIGGMTCEGCAAAVAQAIRQVPGVLAVEVSYQNRQAVVGTDACCRVPKDKILKAIGDAGYSASAADAR